MKYSIHLTIFVCLLIYSMYSFSDEPMGRDPTYGGVEFERSCAICHGFNGKGKGVMSDSLTKQPSDLTVLSKNNIFEKTKPQIESDWDWIEFNVWESYMCYISDASKKYSGSKVNSDIELDLNSEIDLGLEINGRNRKCKKI